MGAIDIGPGFDRPIRLDRFALAVRGQLVDRRARLGDEVLAIRSAP